MRPSFLLPLALLCAACDTTTPVRPQPQAPQDTAPDLEQLRTAADIDGALTRCLAELARLEAAWERGSDPAIEQRWEQASLVAAELYLRQHRRGPDAELSLLESAEEHVSDVSPEGALLIPYRRVAGLLARSFLDLAKIERVSPDGGIARGPGLLKRMRSWSEDLDASERAWLDDAADRICGEMAASATQQARIQLEASQLEPAEAWARQACDWAQGGPDHGEALLTLGDVLFMQGRLEEALQSYSDGLAAPAPERPQVRTSDAHLMVSLIHVQLSYAVRNDLDEPEWENFERHTLAAIASARAGQLEVERQLAKLNKNYQLARPLSDIAAQLRTIELQRLLELPDLAKEAEAAVRKELVREPGQANLLLILGNLLERRGDIPGARAAYGEALAAAPDSVEVRRTLGTLAYQDASLVQRQLLDVEDPAQQATLDKELAAHFRVAQQHLDFVCQQQPEVVFLRALILIALYFDDQDAYQRYQQQLQALEAPK